MRCWQCGVEPTGLVETTGLGDPEPSYMPTGWPKGDHQHALTPPSPSDLAVAGDAAARRIEAIAAE